MDVTSTTTALSDEPAGVQARLAGLEQTAAAGRCLAALLAQSEARYQALAQATGTAGPVIGLFDRERMAQVISNLVGNAVKYGRGQPLTVDLTAATGVACLTVRDCGIGIPTDQLQRIFDRFVRAVPMQNYGGLGLGLYIVRQIVTAVGGAVTVTSAPGAGAEFTVRLPCRPRPAAFAAELSS